MSGVGEFDLIERIRARAEAMRASRGDVVLGIGDDAAVLRAPSDRLLVVATDTLNAAVHFPGDTAPADIGWKALAVNLSDLAAMGAAPAWASLSLSMPHGDAAWVDAFLDGFFVLADAHRVALIGGDTTRGPLSVCVTVHGFVEPARVMRRDGAQTGDDVWVSGTLGDAAGALVQWRVGAQADASLRARLDRPEPRVMFGQRIAGIASAAIDVSDGLLADLGHVCDASGVGAHIDVDALPMSDALRASFDAEARRALQATGGDDYELCFTAAPAQRGAIEAAARDAGLEVQRIGSIVAGRGVATRAGDAAWESTHAGYTHFE